jgi:hypothetical protein
LPWGAQFSLTPLAAAAVLDFVGAFAFAASGAIVMDVSEND